MNAQPHTTDFMTSQERKDYEILRYSTTDTPITVSDDTGEMDDVPAHFEYHVEDGVRYATLTGFVLCGFPITRDMAVTRLGAHTIDAWEQDATQSALEEDLS